MVENTIDDPDVILKSSDGTQTNLCNLPGEPLTVGEARVFLSNLVKGLTHVTGLPGQMHEPKLCCADIEVPVSKCGDVTISVLAGHVANKR